MDVNKVVQFMIVKSLCAGAGMTVAQNQTSLEILQFLVGHNGAISERNAPTVLNAVFNVDQFWDGRASDLAEQAKRPTDQRCLVVANIWCLK